MTKALERMNKEIADICRHRRGKPDRTSGDHGHDVVRKSPRRRRHHGRRHTATRDPFEEGTTVEAITLASEMAEHPAPQRHRACSRRPLRTSSRRQLLGTGLFITDGFYYDFGNIDAVTLSGSDSKSA